MSRRSPTSNPAEPPEGEASPAEDVSSLGDASEYYVEPWPTTPQGAELPRFRANNDVERLKLELPPSVVRSYLDDGLRSLDELRDSQSLRHITERAAEIVRFCRAPAVQAFYYCVDYPSGTPRAFLDLKRRANLAFHLEGMRIMHMLSEQDRAKLKGTPLADVLEEFLKRDVRLIIQSHLRTRLGDRIAAEIVHHPSTQGRIALGGEEGEVAAKLEKFWSERGKSELRKDRLRSEFAVYGMQMRDHCPFCKAYIEGRVDADVEEVIAVSVIASRLQGRGKAVEAYFPLCEGAFRKCWFVQKLPLEEAVRRAMFAVRSLDRNPEKDRPSEDLPFSALLSKTEITQ